MDKLGEVIGDYSTFLKEVVKRVENAGFDMADFSQCDHMGYRTTSLDQYEDKKRQLSGCAKPIGENVVNDRPIMSLRLNQPVFSGNWRIDTLELIAPRPGHPKPEGLDHIEFVLFDGIETFLEKYKDKKFILDSADRGVNPEIGFELGDGLKVKFHILSLPAVVYIEKKLGITDIK